ncbi:MAG TPA: hypothetical protein VNM87_03935, partial [Candidatus Udaeobacter sp.]|nr:hypothetical protein [Candidatus Udaeobacter sp.]
QDKLHMLANCLLEREILDGEEIDRLLKGETLAPLPPKANGRPPAPEGDGTAGTESAALDADGRRGANEPSRTSGTDSA